MTDSFDFFTTNHNWNADRELSHSHTFPDIPQSRSDSADLHGHFQLCHTHSLILCERFCGCVEALFLPPLFIIMSWNLPLNKSTVFAGSFAGICREDSLSFSPPFLLPLSLSPLLFQIRVNEMVPFTHPIWARPWNTPCFVKRWRGMTCDLQKPPDNYLFTYLCIDCWH